MEPEGKSKSLWSKQKIENIDFTKVFQQILKYKLFGSAQIAKVNLDEIKTVYVIHDKVAKCQFPVAKGRKWRWLVSFMSLKSNWSAT